MNPDLFVEQGMRHDDFISSSKRVSQALRELQKDVDPAKGSMQSKRYFWYQYDTPVLHQVIKCNFKIGDIRKINFKLKEINEVDKFYEWTPLHYMHVGIRLIIKN